MRLTEVADLKIGDFVYVEDPMGFTGYALVIDQDAEDWILELNLDPDPPEYGENTMLWGPASGPLRVVEPGFARERVMGRWSNDA